MESSNSCERIIDANLNRSKEALRVVEDILRFNYNDEDLATQAKSIRATLGTIAKQHIKTIAHRDTQNDCLTQVTLNEEKKRESLFDILIANFKRAQESLRVLEEVFKLVNVESSLLSKQLRYKTYILEKQVYDRYSKY
ncbi:MAG: thiamine-phosphate pyrophosphorylase [Desulfurella sp.]|jgi:thiamine-phosphate pyrophosphorylase